MTNLSDATILLIVTDVDADQIVAVHACANITDALDRVAATITHPDEDLDAVRSDVAATWAEDLHSDRPGEFTMRREVGAPNGRFCSFALFAVERIGVTDLPDAARRPAASTADPAVVADRMLRLIDADLAEHGWSPVTCFADLHDFCDANDYVAEALDHDYRLGTADEDLDVINAATAIVDARLIERHAATRVDG